MTVPEVDPMNRPLRYWCPRHGELDADKVFRRGKRGGTLAHAPSGSRRLGYQKERQFICQEVEVRVRGADADRVR